ncbi:Hypothetical predicted protein [Paramuricea clavata]|uniref:Uncharacterized protein n=1 Tax=Paramuricea clavata TaxID=317549 RepID=A0A6S7LT25_PARCT|nr:Hypothetical predicted protein [Paramuricea clavata]
MHILFDVYFENISEISCHYSDQLAEIGLLNVQILPGSPTQDGADAILSFFVELPSGTIPSNLLTTIFTTSPNIVPQQTSVVNLTLSQNPDLTNAETENLIPLTITTYTIQDIRSDVQVSIAKRLNEYCQNNSDVQLCSTTR